MNIIFSANNNEKICIIPIIPTDFLIDFSKNNETFERIQGQALTLLGNKSLKSFSLDSFFPMKKYSFAKNGSFENGWKYINFFNEYSNKRLPLRVIVTDDKNNYVICNMACTLESFTYGMDRQGDIKYSLSVKEYVFANTKKVKK